MTDAKWKNALWNVLDGLRLGRLTARVALSAGLLGLATQSAADDPATRVPVSPVLEPEVAVRRLKGRYVLRRVANALTVRFAGHGSHSSHSSHASHSSHSSSSHYSGAHSSHFSSSPSPPSPSPQTPPPKPAPPQPTEPEPRSPQPALRPTPRRSAPNPVAVVPRQIVLNETFQSSMRAVGRWRVGVLATPPETFDAAIALGQGQGVMNIASNGHAAGSHFSGYVSVPSFDLNIASIAVRLRHPAAGGVTLFAAAIDANNWVGFRIDRGQLVIESHAGGRVATKAIGYDAAQHRFLRLRRSQRLPVVAWETSADGHNWTPQYVETAAIKLNDLRIALSAGSTGRAEVGAAAFGGVVVEKTQ